jgi:hypothetical protein
MNSYLFVEFTEELGEALKWLTTSSGDAGARRLVSCRPEVDAYLKQKNIPSLPLFSCVINPAEYATADALMRTLSAKWRECLLADHSGDRPGDALPDDFYSKELSVYFFWVLRQVIATDKFFSSNQCSKAYFFKSKYQVDSVLNGAGESVLGPLLGAFQKKYGYELSALDSAAIPLKKRVFQGAAPADLITVFKKTLYYIQNLMLSGGKIRAGIALSGSLATLAPVADQLIKRAGFSICFIRPRYDRQLFAFWLKNRIPTVCPHESPPSREWNQKAAPARFQAKPCVFQGIDLSPVVADKVIFLLNTAMPAAARRIMDMRAWLEGLGARWLVVDEDITQWNRSLVLAAGRMGIKTVVCQHGLPADPVGYLPLSSDYFISWGPGSSEKLRDWGMDPRKILELGAPKYDFLFHQAENGSLSGKRYLSRRETKILFIMSYGRPSHRPGRASSDHMTPDYLEEMLHSLCVSLRGVEGVLLVLKPRPVETNLAFVRSLMGRYSKGLNWKILNHKKYAMEFMSKCDLVVGTESTAMAEALILGIPSVCVNFSMKINNYPMVKDGISLEARSSSDLERAIRLCLSADYRAGYLEKRRELLKRYFSETGGNSSKKVANFILNAEE